MTNDEVDAEFSTAAKRLVDLCNYFGGMGSKDDIGGAALLVEAIRKEHRTIQQNFWRIIISAMMIYAEDEKNPDLRNQASVDMTKKVTKFIKENNIYLPLV